jgi:hypothetical protein
MTKTLLGGLSCLLALLLSLSALGVFFRCLQSWRNAPDTTHMTMIVAGMQFTGGQLLIPLAGFTIGAIAAGLFGLKTLKTRS